jgi:hypothetical protein
MNEVKTVTTPLYKVQIGKKQSAYKTRWSFINKEQALLYYRAINIGNGFKKRLLEDNKVIAREIS